MGCRVFFDGNRGNPEKCKDLQKFDVETLTSWEDQLASEFSPGTVQDEEILYQQIVDPTHLEPNGKGLRPTAFQDSANKGMSTNRGNFISWDDLVARGKKRASDFNMANPERPQRSLWGFARFRAEDVRRIVPEPEGQRYYFVYDTANPDDVSHADICQGVAGDKKTERSIRASLFDLAKGALKKLDEVDVDVDVDNDNLMPPHSAQAA